MERTGAARGDHARKTETVGLVENGGAVDYADSSVAGNERVDSIEDRLGLATI